MSAAGLYAANGDCRLAYEVRGTGEPLLLVHGLAYARWGWEPVVDALAEHFAVVLFDNRGVGESDAPPGPYSVAQLAADAAAVLDAAELERAHIVGTSLGGMVAQQLAVVHPERVERLVLACTTPGGPQAWPMPDVTASLLARMPLMPLDVALLRAVENALAEPREELIERILEHRLAKPQTTAAWLAQAAAGAAFDLFDRIGEIQAPTLVLHGTEDVVVDPRNAELLAERIPDARVELVPGTGHLFFWEQPERFVSTVREFLS